MKRFGILSADLEPDDPIDVYQTDERYWRSFWYVPQTRRSKSAEAGTSRVAAENAAAKKAGPQAIVRDHMAQWKQKDPGR